MVQIEALNIPECQEGVTSPDGLLEGKHDRVKSETCPLGKTRSPYIANINPGSEYVC